MTYEELEQLNLPSNIRVLIYNSPYSQYEASLRWAKIYKGFHDKKIKFEVIIVRYTYGMRLRGFSLGAQPINGFIERKDSLDKKYHDLIVYNRKLTDEEITQYELDLIDPIQNSALSDYNKIQDIFPNDIIIYRIGEFYEIIGKNAMIVSENLNLTLFRRENHPMVVFPIRYVDKFITKLKSKNNLVVVNSYNDIKRIFKESFYEEQKDNN